jgi:hypothetical protein
MLEMVSIFSFGFLDPNRGRAPAAIERDFQLTSPSQHPVRRREHHRPASGGPGGLKDRSDPRDLGVTSFVICGAVTLERRIFVRHWSGLRLSGTLLAV